MEKRGISQEGLKLIACVTMLIDHVGATLVLEYYLQIRSFELYCIYYAMRLIGRIAFPIFCFLLVEGAHYTRNPRKYAVRLAIGALLSEIPFDIAFFGGITMEHSSVMITLLLGFGMIQAMKKLEGFWKIAVILPFFVAAELLGTDYGGHGIAIIALLALTRGVPYEKLLRAMGLAVLLWFGANIRLGWITVPMEEFALLGLPLIFTYQGRKVTGSKALQWGFYLFYPVHIAVLCGIQWLIFGAA